MYLPTKMCPSRPYTGVLPVDPWQAWSGAEVIPVYTTHKMELLCSQRRTRYGITLSIWDCCPYKYQLICK
ncbi:hypothetical protein NP493_81g01017 [Ridgeia piscesae]|uniref:Uncharacterized protein n=1 Tax=Ridgeia piscesae TaxID=27915 RepID=A0AAD9P9C1_RIDPI|nr:hypothetical protein NP493_81g01017 [Ridgeia piscesae]